MYLRLSNGYRARAASGTNLKGIEIPRQWYNLIADLPVKPPPPLHPKTLEPVKPEDLSPLFPDELIKQEASNDKFIDIPDEVLDIYSLWRPTPLIRFVLLLYNGFIFFILRIFLRLPWQEVSYILKLNLEPRGWRSSLTHLPEFTTSTKVSALLDRTSPTLQSHKSGIMLSKVLRML
jgi:hypothetical protein